MIDKKSIILIVTLWAHLDWLIFELMRNNLGKEISFYVLFIGPVWIGLLLSLSKTYPNK